MMVRLYCRKQEGNDCLCEECRALLEYAHARLEHCPFGERKTSCKHCKIHCYKPGMAAENAAGDALCRSENVILSPADSFETFVR